MNNQPGRKGIDCVRMREIAFYINTCTFYNKDKVHNCIGKLTWSSYFIIDFLFCVVWQHNDNGAHITVSDAHLVNTSHNIDDCGRLCPAERANDVSHYTNRHRFGKCVTNLFSVSKWLFSDS